MDTENDKKLELLNELSQYVDVSTGRKHRSDAGNIRGKYGPHDYTNKPQTKVALYNRVAARVKEKALDRGFDENGYYIVIPKSYATDGKAYKQKYQGREIVHTVRRYVAQKEIDLEQYRFEAWQELALDVSSRNIPISPIPDIVGVLVVRTGLTPVELRLSIKKLQMINYDWFREMYHVDRPEDWDYVTWKSHYDCCPPQLLDEEFKFDKEHKPGTEEFHPEWAWYVQRQETQAREDEENENERKRVQYLANLRQMRR